MSSATIIQKLSFAWSATKIQLKRALEAGFLKWRDREKIQIRLSLNRNSINKTPAAIEGQL